MPARIATLVVAVAVAVAVAVLASLVGGGLPARAAAAPLVLVERADPLMTAPVTVRVAVHDQAGTALPFTGGVVLTVGRTRATATVTGDASGVGLASVPTATLSGGDATLTASITAAGATTKVVLPFFARIDGGITVGPYSCATVRPGGGAVRWAVTSLNGEPLRTPESRDVPLLPYVGSSAPRWTMVDEDWRPLATSGTVTIRQAGKVVAGRKLPKAVRRLVFGSSWDGRVGGAFRPGVYTADLLLRDATGRTASATQAVIVAAKGAATACAG